MLKRIGTAARLRMEELLGRRVHLELFVRVTDNWRERPGQLADFGLLGDHGGDA
jgi:GTP-binding protein Era